jgi:hypothetical protein
MHWRFLKSNWLNANENNSPFLRYCFRSVCKRPIIGNIKKNAILEASSDAIISIREKKMSRKQILPTVSSVTVGRLTAEKAGQEDGLETNTQLDFRAIYTEIMQTGTSVQLDNAEANMQCRRSEWIEEFSQEQPDLFRYIRRFDSKKIVDLFRIILERGGIQRVSAQFLAENLEKMAGQQILDVVYTIYEGLHAEAETHTLTQLWDA